MKEIQPINIWFNGQNIQVNNLNVFIIYDNLSTSATFCYQLLKVNVENEVTSSQQLSQGNLTMDNIEYENWGENGNINQEAYVWVANQLNLILI